MKILFLIGSCLLVSWVAWAKSPDEDDLLVNIDEYENNLDSLITLWHARTLSDSFVFDSINDNEEQLVEELPDSVYIQRLEEIQSPIVFPFNKQVKSYIKLYTQKRRDQVALMLGLSDYYFPIFEAALDAHDMPLELKYLPVIESALNPLAFSHAGASGLWQFMYYTGKQYGLKVDSYVDERRDPYYATEAAVKFLSDLYDIYGDWYLVIAAYNCGPGNVNKAIRRSGGKRNFWEIYYRLPQETRGYVPAFVAAAYTFTYARDHNIVASHVTLPLATDTIMVSQPLHFEQIADLTHVQKEVLRELNPMYRRDVVPAGKKIYPLRLPFIDATLFASIEDTIYTYRRDEFFPSGSVVVEPSLASHSVVAPPGYKSVYYKVKSGDVVGLIAEWFDVRLSDLKYWNNINRNMIRVGQKLVVYVPQGKVTHYEGVARQHGTTSVVSTAAVTTVPLAADTDNYVYHTVRSGDSVWSIAKQYSGVTSDDILRLNHLSNGSKIKPGQQLKIKPRS
jgi:membrane-bound lytic murein transglycosylase D